jgi:hypothetical protein
MEPYSSMSCSSIFTHLLIFRDWSIRPMQLLSRSWTVANHSPPSVHVWLPFDSQSHYWFIEIAGLLLQLFPQVPKYAGDAFLRLVAATLAASSNTLLQHETTPSLATECMLHTLPLTVTPFSHLVDSTLLWSITFSSSNTGNDLCEHDAPCSPKRCESTCSEKAACLCLGDQWPCNRTKCQTN